MCASKPRSKKKRGERPFHFANDIRVIYTVWTLQHRCLENCSSAVDKMWTRRTLSMKEKVHAIAWRSCIHVLFYSKITQPWSTDVRNRMTISAATIPCTRITSFGIRHPKSCRWSVLLWLNMFYHNVWNVQVLNEIYESRKRRIAIIRVSIILHSVQKLVDEINVYRFVYRNKVQIPRLCRTLQIKKRFLNTQPQTIRQSQTSQRSTAVRQKSLWIWTSTG